LSGILNVFFQNTLTVAEQFDRLNNKKHAKIFGDVANCVKHTQEQTFFCNKLKNN
jgi:hypothetical protein